MAPMEQRVADGKGDRLRPLLKLLPVRGIAGNEPFIHADGAHEPPLVVVAAKPHLGDIFKPPILVDLLRV